MQDLSTRHTGASGGAQQDANHSSARFLSLMTHELRAPLNTINGYLDLALNEIAGELNPQLREFLQRARASSEHLFGIVENLLLLTRADTGQLRLKREMICLRDVIVDAVEEMEVTARDKNITVSVEIAEDFPALSADSSRLQQVIRNLLSNALRFTTEGGRVELAAWMDATSDGQPVARLRISDNGSGIAPEFHERIFERFFQVPGCTGGQGLGLAVVKMIIEWHGGTVRVSSSPAEGSVFLCELPVQRETECL